MVCKRIIKICVISFSGSGKRWIITLCQKLQPGVKATVELHDISL